VWVRAARLFASKQIHPACNPLGFLTTNNSSSLRALCVSVFTPSSYRILTSRVLRSDFPAD
jgi:hypothetical protein